jgi:two-component system, OmpR family, response regulator NblR
MTVNVRSYSILLVEPDEGYAKPICSDLEAAGYQVVSLSEPRSVLKQLSNLQPDLILIDRMLIGSSGLTLSSQLRAAGVSTPVLILMTKDALEDRVACLEAGADDYFLKSYRSEELLKSIRLYLHPKGAGAQESEQLRFGDITLDLGNRQAIRGQRVIDLTMKEFDLLKYFMEHPREILSREQILENVWGYDFEGESNVIEVYIRYLRIKIEDEGNKRLIQTVRGVGYVLREI